MTDGAQALLWTGVLGGGIAACVVLRRWGVPSTYVRDVLHVGAGVWVLGWPWWNGWTVPSGIALAGAAGTAAVPALARRSHSVAAFQRSVSGGDERWTGLVLYTLAFAALTPVGIAALPFAAGAALWALCLGDGLGGAVGRRFGRTRFAVPGAKHKSVEGAVAVAVAAAVGALAAGAWFDRPVTLGEALLLGAVASVAEAVAPRSSDNLLVPASVFGVALWIG